MNFSNFFIDVLNGNDPSLSLGSKKNTSPAFLFSDIMKVCEDENTTQLANTNSSTSAETSKEIFSAADSVINIAPQEFINLNQLVAAIIKESGDQQPASTNYNIDEALITKQQFIIPENKLVDLLGDLIEKGNYPLGPFIKQLQTSESSKPISLSFKSGADKLTISFNPIKVDENSTNMILNDEYGFVNKLIVKEGLFDIPTQKLNSSKELTVNEKETDSEKQLTSEDEGKPTENINPEIPNQIFFRTEIIKIISTNLPAENSISGILPVKGETTISTFLAYKNYVKENKQAAGPTINTSNEVDLTAQNNGKTNSVNYASANSTSKNEELVVSGSKVFNEAAATSKITATNTKSVSKSDTLNTTNASSDRIDLDQSYEARKNVSIASLLDGLSDEEKSVFNNYAAKGEIKEITFSKELINGSNKIAKLKADSGQNVLQNKLADALLTQNLEIKTSDQAPVKVESNELSLVKNMPNLNQIDETISVGENTVSYKPINGALGSKTGVENQKIEPIVNATTTLTNKIVSDTIVGNSASLDSENQIALSTNKKNHEVVSFPENTKIFVKVNGKSTVKVDVKTEPAMVNISDALSVDAEKNTNAKPSAVNENKSVTENFAKTTNESTSETKPMNVDQIINVKPNIKLEVASNSKTLSTSDIKSGIEEKTITSSDKNLNAKSENVTGNKQEAQPIIKTVNEISSAVKSTDTKEALKVTPVVKEENIVSAKNETVVEKNPEIIKKENAASDKTVNEISTEVKVGDSKETQPITQTKSKVTEQTKSTDSTNVNEVKPGTKEENATITKSVDSTEKNLEIAAKEIKLSDDGVSAKSTSENGIKKEALPNTKTSNEMTVETKSTDLNNVNDVKPVIKEETAADSKNVVAAEKNLETVQNEKTTPDKNINVKSNNEQEIKKEVQPNTKNAKDVEQVSSTSSKETQNGKPTTKDESIVDNNNVVTTDKNLETAQKGTALSDKYTNLKSSIDDISGKVKTNESEHVQNVKSITKEENSVQHKDVVTNKNLDVTQNQISATDKKSVSSKADSTIGKVEPELNQELVSKVIAKEDKPTVTKENINSKESISDDVKTVKHTAQDGKANLTSDDETSKRSSNESFKNNLTQSLTNDFDIEKTKVFSDLKTFHEPVKIIKQSEIIPEFSKLIQQSEKQTMTFQISPENLGKVKLIVDLVNNQIQTKIEVESEQIKQFIQSNVEQLKQNLQASGIQLSNVNISLTDYNQKNTAKMFAPKKKINDRSEKEITTEEISDQPLKKMGYNTYEYLA